MHFCDWCIETEWCWLQQLRAVAKFLSYNFVQIYARTEVTLKDSTDSW